MSRKLSTLMVALMLLAAPGAFAQDQGASSDAPTAEGTSSDGGVSLSEGGGTGVRASGGLLDKSDQSANRKMMLSFLAELGWGYWSAFGVGAGARFAIPIVKNGFLPMLNDSFWIEFGADFRFHFPWWYSGVAFGLTIPIEVMWMFHILPNLAAYYKLSLGLSLFFGNVYWAGGGVGFAAGFHHQFAMVGVLYHLSDTIALRAEVGYSDFKAGISIKF